MAFGSKVQHGTGAVLGRQRVHKGTVAQVALHKGMLRVALQADQVLQITCVGQFVQIDDGIYGMSAPVEHEVCADEASATS